LRTCFVIPPPRSRVSLARGDIQSQTHGRDVRRAGSAVAADQLVVRPGLSQPRQEMVVEELHPVLVAGADERSRLSRDLAVQLLEATQVVDRGVHRAEVGEEQSL